MSWPQAQEYNEAIQNPRICFQDPDLKQGTVKTNAMGIPIAISGGFASVYQLTTPSGKWAIRCFIREVSDSYHRYSEISKALNSHRPPYTAPFEFQQAGIRVGTRTYPIVKMQWMTGELLGDYIARNVSNPHVLAQLAEKWSALIADLRTRKLAHGDLQHGNVIVVNDEPKLIDYDGMFVPAFQGMKSNEKGHPNFQHPRRQETDFGLYTDNFSAWVIYASLRILAASPEIYSLSRGLGRDECIIFNREDYANPGASPIFGQLRLHHDDTVTKLSERIATLLTQAPKDIPSLDTSAFPTTVVTTVVIGPSEWWRDHIRAPTKVEPVAPVPPVSIEIEPQPKAQREMLVLMLTSCVAFAAGRGGVIGYGGYLIIQGVAVLGAYHRLRHHFNRCPTVAARNRHYQEVQLKDEEASEKKQRLEENRKKIADNDQAEKNLAGQLQAVIAEITGKQGQEIKQVYTEQAVARAEWTKRKQVLVAEEERGLKTATMQSDSDAVQITNQISRLATKEGDMCRDALERIRKDTMNASLSRHLISSATISGIGPRFKGNLRYAGIQTAADVSYAKVRNVDGFGHARTATILSWRQALESRYESRLPSQLSPAERNQITQQINTKRAELNNLLITIRANLTEAKNRVTQSYDGRRSQLAAEEQRINAVAQSKITAINSKHAAQIAGRQSDFEQTKRNLQRETANARVAINCLEADIRRIQAWQRDVGMPRSQGYETLTFGAFCNTVFNSKFN